jgi:protein SCO1
MTRLLGTALLASLLLPLAACDRYEPHGTLIEPMAVPDFTLVSADGEVRKSDFEGQLVVIFFGFTACPDVCPDTMGRLARAVRMLDPREAEQIQVLLVSVDPERDGPAEIDRYASRFDERFRGLTGSREQIATVASGYGIFFEETPLEGGGYTVDHSAYTIVLNRQGETVLIWRYGLDAEDLADDLRYLIRNA